MTFTLNLSENDSDSGNAIKQGFKNLISIIEPNQHEVEYTKGILSADSTSSESWTDDSDESDDDGLENDSDAVKRFYSLKGNDDDISQTDNDEDDDQGTFNAIKTKSLATLLNLSKKLTNISLPNGYSQSNRSEIEYSEQESYITSGCESSAQVGLKSGWYKR